MPDPRATRCDICLFHWWTQEKPVSLRRDFTDSNRSVLRLTKMTDTLPGTFFPGTWRALILYHGLYFGTFFAFIFAFYVALDHQQFMYSVRAASTISCSPDLLLDSGVLFLIYDFFHQWNRLSPIRCSRRRSRAASLSKNKSSGMSDAELPVV